mmetsp:Transcript_12340/g.23242  ORF Transcript_12340/g.23242 Transcript_12340/m.23242 type:complete len:332 (+) Transcript_12340:56-1051(+)
MPFARLLLSTACALQLADLEALCLLRGSGKEPLVRGGAVRLINNGTGSGNQSLFQERDEAAMKLHRAEQKIEELQQELIQSKGLSFDWPSLRAFLSKRWDWRHWILLVMVLLVAGGIVCCCCLCGSCMLRTGERGCEDLASCTACLVKTDWLLLKSTCQLVYRVWKGLHERTRATILLVNVMTAAGIALLWWITSNNFKHRQGSEYLLLLTVRWGYLGMVMCCWPGILFLTISCCEFWAFLADFGNNFSDYIMEMAGEVVNFQEEVTKQTTERYAACATQCWQGAKKTFGCANDSPVPQPTVQTFARSALQAKPKRERVRPVLKLERILEH